MTLDLGRDLTIGIEQEFQIIDAGTGSSPITSTRCCCRPRDQFGEDVKAEMLQSAVEIGTQICADIDCGPRRAGPPTRRSRRDSGP